MADIERCKLCGFIGFHIQTSAHFKRKHPEEDYEQNIEVLLNTDKDYKQYGFRPSINYYKDKIAGKKVSPFDYER